MMAAPTGLDALVHELLAVLDEEIATLDRRCAELQNLSEAIVLRDDARMAQCLEAMEQTQSRQESIDRRLGAVRNALAIALGRRTGQVRLTSLIALLPTHQGDAVATRHRRVVEQIRTVQRQHQTTSTLLMESARINRLLLESLLPRNDTVVTYGQAGQTCWRGHTGLMDAEL